MSVALRAVSQGISFGTLGSITELICKNMWEHVDQDKKQINSHPYITTTLKIVAFLADMAIVVAFASAFTLPTCTWGLLPVLIEGFTAEMRTMVLGNEIEGIQNDNRRLIDSLLCDKTQKCIDVRNLFSSRREKLEAELKELEAELKELEAELKEEKEKQIKDLKELIKGCKDLEAKYPEVNKNTLKQVEDIEKKQSFFVALGLCRYLVYKFGDNQSALVQVIATVADAVFMIISAFSPFLFPAIFCGEIIFTISRASFASLKLKTVWLEHKKILDTTDQQLFPRIQLQHKPLPQNP